MQKGDRFKWVWKRVAESIWKPFSPYGAQSFNSERYKWAYRWPAGFLQACVFPGLAMFCENRIGIFPNNNSALLRHRSMMTAAWSQASAAHLLLANHSALRSVTLPLTKGQFFPTCRKWHSSPVFHPRGPSLYETEKGQRGAEVIWFCQTESQSGMLGCSYEIAPGAK